MTQQETQAGFNAPRSPQSDWVKKLYDKHNLPEAPSLEEVESVATDLLSNPLTMVEGAELVLGRHINAEEIAINDGISLLPFIAKYTTGPERFAILLMQVAIEQRNTET